MEQALVYRETHEIAGVVFRGPITILMLKQQYQSSKSKNIHSTKCNINSTISSAIGFNKKQTFNTEV